MVYPHVLRATNVLLMGGALWLGAACDSVESTTGGAGTGGTGGATSGGGGQCLRVPAPTFLLTVVEKNGGPVPPDTQVDVHWSAGDEPSFKLDEPSTWGSIETTNLVCEVDPTLPPPTDLPMLLCALWTSSPAEVKVSATGFETHKDTYMAEPTAECNPDPTPIVVELEQAPQ
ncbi:MAG: hypothetical protein IPK82_27355 [Polyangiaceae bacterium]|nr:hypothetical protein [Polyangiaceae bacterium]